MFGIHAVVDRKKFACCVLLLVVACYIIVVVVDVVVEIGQSANSLRPMHRARLVVDICHWPMAGLRTPP